MEAKGWNAVVDPRTGRTYYANRMTGETSWTPPAAAAAGAAAVNDAGSRLQPPPLSTLQARRQQPKSGPGTAELRRTPPPLATLATRRANGNHTPPPSPTAGPRGAAAELEMQAMRPAEQEASQWTEREGEPGGGKTERPRVGCCLCRFSSRRNCCICCWSVFLLIVGLLVFFFWPRASPTICH